MTRNPVTAFVGVSADAIGDALGEAPPTLLIAGATVNTTFGGAGTGRRAYFTCPVCGERVLLLYIPKQGGLPACRHCWRVCYPGSFLRRTAVEPLMAKIRRSFA
jgi:hypothetical protein